MTTPEFDNQEIRALLPLYVGGDLEPETLARVRAHLAEHPELAEEAAALQRARERLRDASLAEARAETEPLDLWPGIRSELAREGRFAGSDAASTGASSATVLGSTVASDTHAGPSPSHGSQPRGSLLSMRGASLFVGAVAAAAIAWIGLATQHEPLGSGAAIGASDPAGEVAELTTTGFPSQPFEATPVAQDAGSSGLRRVMSDDPSLDDGRPKQPRRVWLVPSQPVQGNSLAGYR